MISNLNEDDIELKATIHRKKAVQDFNSPHYKKERIYKPFDI